MTAEHSNYRVERHTTQLEAEHSLQLTTHTINPDLTGYMAHTVIEVREQNSFWSGADDALALANAHPDMVKKLSFHRLYAPENDGDVLLPRAYVLGVLSVALAWQPRLAAGREIILHIS